MSTEGLYKNLVVLDRNEHRQLRLREQNADLRKTSQMHAVFVTAAEFVETCREYPIVFVRAGKDEAGGPDPIAPMAVLGLKANENLYLKPDGTWRTPYLPAYFRRYPFAMAAIAPQQMAVCFDRAFEGFSDTEGSPLFDAQGEPTELMKDVQRFVETYEVEMQRTRMLCEELQRRELLRDMRFDATLPNGEKLTVDGFLAIDEEKLAALPDAAVLELHRNGILALIHAHQVSMGLMRRLVEWRLQGQAAQA